MTTKHFFKYLLALSAIAFSPLSSFGGTLSWDFVARNYSDFAGTEAPLVFGTIVTSDSLDGRGIYEIQSVSGQYGGDLITGLSTRANYRGYTPDNGISLNRTDVLTGCMNWSYLPLDLTFGPHFSCAGVSFQTSSGSINLSFGGATEVLVGYDGQPLLMVRSQITPAIPEPGTWGLMVAGLALLCLTERRSRKRRPIPA